MPIQSAGDGGVTGAYSAALTPDLLSDCATLVMSVLVIVNRQPNLIPANGFPTGTIIQISDIENIQLIPIFKHLL